MAPLKLAPHYIVHLLHIWWGGVFFSCERWFGEELFMYIRVFGIIASPHVLPFYVPDKLMAREIKR